MYINIVGRIKLLIQLENEKSGKLDIFFLNHDVYFGCENSINWIIFSKLLININLLQKFQQWEKKVYKISIGGQGSNLLIF